MYSHHHKTCKLRPKKRQVDPWREEMENLNARSVSSLCRSVGRDRSLRESDGKAGCLWGENQAELLPKQNIQFTPQEG